MKKIIVLFLILSSSLFAQKETNIWYFGIGAGIDFNSGTATAITSTQIGSDVGGPATISTSSGELLFYTDSQFIYNKNHEVMQNGDNIGGTLGSTQAAIIVPKPGDSNIYYVLTTGAQADHRGMKYTIVDIRLDNGLGGVTAKDLFLSNLVTEKLTAIKSTSFNGYWVVAHRWDSNKFMVFKVTSSGVDTTPTEYAIGPIISGDVTNTRGQLKLAPSGQKLAMANEGVVNELYFFDFDPSTGEISNPRLILDENADTKVYGVEFSPNGKLLYVSGKKNGVFQYNLEAGNISDIRASKLKLNIFENRNFSGLQIGSDGRIYVAKQYFKHLDYVENPDVLGVGCNYRYEAGGLFLGDFSASGEGFPQFIQSYFFVGFSAENLCEGNSTQFTANISESYDSISWDFGDGNTSTQENPVHTYNQAGTYTVTLSVTSGANASVETQEVTIYKTPSATQPSDMIVCDDDDNGFYNFNLTNQTNTILNGQNISEFEVDYYASMTDYNNDNKISDYSSYQNMSSYQEQTIVARVTNKQNPDCEAITSFKISVFESPKPALSVAIPNLSDCDNTSVGTDIDGKIKFNLKDRETAILNGQSVTDFEVTYYEDENLTQLINNPTDYTNNTTTQKIYAKVENKLNANCFAKTFFLLEVFELPVINSPVSLKQCDNADINGFSSINLNEAKEKIVSNPNGYIITFFEEEAHAKNNTNPIPNPTAYTNQTVSNDKVWARVENTNGCFRVNEVNIIVSTTQVPSTFQKSFYKCDDGTITTDGIATFDFSSVTQEVTNLFPVNQKLIINYYRNESDALAEFNAITDIANYQNIGYPNQQNIYIRVDSELDNDCLGLGHHITLNVEKVPIANPVTIHPECDNDRDGVFSFDTSNIQSTIIGNQTNVVVTYFDENNNPLSSPLPNPFITDSQTIKARIVNTTSQDPNGQCYNETTIDFIVNSVPIANTVSPQELCDDDFDGIADFDTSNIESTILGTQTGMIVKYFDENNNPLPSPLSNPFMTISQRITVRVENPEYAVCYDETTIDFIVREKPDFELEEEATICITNNSSLDISVQNPTASYSYEWKDENGGVISNDIIANVSKGGVYSVKATSMFGCESEIKSIEVKESSISNITIDNLEITDDSENNSIRINTQNTGLGTYEFSLIDSDSNIIYGYQTTPFFDDLEGGIYTIHIRDINGCGIQSFETSIISYPKFFTPNDDGINDTWHIKGIGKSFYKNGIVHIFNRYGKVIKSLSLDDNGWNGFYNGQKLPSNDYWFQAKLTDPKGNLIIRKGNFSLLRR